MVETLRRELAARYLRGRGLEIGALHQPLALPAEAEVTYVDWLSLEALRSHYPELAGERLVEVGLIDDGEILGKVPDGSQDFIIANHMLEHCENPIGTLRNHLGKLRDGGIAFYALPHRNFSFDRDRPVTDFQHVLFDDQVGPEGSREQHYREVVTITEKQRGNQALTRLRELMASRYRIHFHVWDRAGLFEFFVRSDEYLTNAFTLVEFAENGPELLSVLMKRPDPELEQRIREIDAIRSRGERKPVCDRVCARIQKLYGVLRSRR